MGRHLRDGAHLPCVRAGAELLVSGKANGHPGADVSVVWAFRSVTGTVVRALSRSGEWGKFVNMRYIVYDYCLQVQSQLFLEVYVWKLYTCSAGVRAVCALVDESRTVCLLRLESGLASGLVAAAPAGLSTLL